MNALPFWETKTLAQMTHTEWESLCDGCGRCCLHKLEDEDSGDIVYTSVACKLFNDELSCCSDYAARKKKVPTCTVLTAENVATFHLPSSCAYRRLSEGKPLPDWHPLITGDKNSVVDAGMSMRERTINENDIDEEDIIEHVLHWVN